MQLMLFLYLISLLSDIEELSLFLHMQNLKAFLFKTMKSKIFRIKPNFGKGCKIWQLKLIL